MRLILASGGRTPQARTAVQAAQSPGRLRLQASEKYDEGRAGCWRAVNHAAL